MYLIPKNIKVKREIFKGFGILEIIILSTSFIFGFFIQYLVHDFYMKVFLFFLFPLTTFLLLMPLPNGSTPFLIFRKFIKYQTNQKQYKYK